MLTTFLTASVRKVSTRRIIRETTGLGKGSLLQQSLHPAPGYPWPVGLCVEGVVSGSGAAEAGVRPGNDMTKVFTGGQWHWITAQDGLTDAVESAPAGALTWVEPVRGGLAPRHHLGFAGAREAGSTKTNLTGRHCCPAVSRGGLVADIGVTHL